MDQSTSPSYHQDFITDNINITTEMKENIRLFDHTEP